MGIQVLFPTLIGEFRADPALLARIAAEVQARESQIKPLLSHAWGDNVLTSFPAEPHLFRRAGLACLSGWIESQVLAFVQQTREGAWQIVPEHTQSWVNLTRRFGFQERHNHDAGQDGLPVSGVYYFQTSGRDGDLSILPTDALARLFDPHVITPATGKLVLFRSEVYHRVGANMGDTDRVSFSFNYLLRPA